MSVEQWVPRSSHSPHISKPVQNQLFRIKNGPLHFEFVYGLLNVCPLYGQSQDTQVGKIFGVVIVVQIAFLDPVSGCWEPKATPRLQRDLVKFTLLSELTVGLQNPNMRPAARGHVVAQMRLGYAQTEGIRIASAQKQERHFVLVVFKVLG